MNTARGVFGEVKISVVGSFDVDVGSRLSYCSSIDDFK